MLTQISDVADRINKFLTQDVKVSVRQVEAVYDAIMSDVQLAEHFIQKIADYHNIKPPAPTEPPTKERATLDIKS
jgi:hypothetical protein